MPSLFSNSKEKFAKQWQNKIFLRMRKGIKLNVCFSRFTPMTQLRTWGRRRFTILPLNYYLQVNLVLFYSLCDCLFICFIFSLESLISEFPRLSLTILRWRTSCSSPMPRYRSTSKARVYQQRETKWPDLMVFSTSFTRVCKQKPGFHVWRLRL